MTTENQSSVTNKPEWVVSADRRPIGWNFWGMWVLTSALGGAIGLIGLGERLVIYATSEQRLLLWRWW